MGGTAQAEVYAVPGQVGGGVTACLPLPEHEAAALDPGIRDIVVALRARGFETCDSGDGTKHGRMGCAQPNRHVAIEAEASMLCEEAQEALRVLREFEPDTPWVVNASYDPADGEAYLYCEVVYPTWRSARPLSTS